MGKRALGFGIAAAAVIVALAGWHFAKGTEQARAAAPASAQLVPVTAATATRRDVPVLLDGLGTVQALNTVDIKAQVNGTLIAVPAHEGQYVHKGDIIAEIDPRPYKAALDQAKAQREGDAAQLQSGTLDLQRYQALANRNFAPIQQVDDQRATVDKSAAAVAADDAAIETAQINLGYCTIRSPIDGRVSLYQVDAGNLIEVATQSAIVTITQTRPIDVVFTLPEADLPRVQAARGGQEPIVIADDAKSGKPIAQGALMTPNNAIDTTTGTISLKAQFPNDDDHLWPGQFVNARIQVELLKNAVTVPDGAIEHGPDGLFVYVIKPDTTVAPAAVEVGYDADGQSVVTKGLSGGEKIVTSGQSRLAPGMRVKITNASDATQAQAAGGAQPAGGQTR